jgi:hypothetical protein
MHNPAGLCSVLIEDRHIPAEHSISSCFFAVRRSRQISRGFCPTNKTKLPPVIIAGVPPAGFAGRFGLEPGNMAQVRGLLEGLGVRFSDFDNRVFHYGADGNPLVEAIGTPLLFNFRPWRFGLDGLLQIPPPPCSVAFRANVRENFGLFTNNTLDNATDDSRTSSVRNGRAS